MIAKDAPMPKKLPAANRPDPQRQLLETLDLQSVSENRFRGSSPQNGWKRIYGGQVLAQAMQAATRTVAVERPLHSLHAYFLLPGDPAVDIAFNVEHLRDGGSFTTRRVTALQTGQPIFAMIASFHGFEDGFEHAQPMPTVPSPDVLQSIGDLVRRPDATVPDAMRGYYAQEHAFDVRPVEPDRFLRQTNGSSGQHLWVKSRAPLPEAASLHAAILAYVSDFALIDTVLIPHDRTMFDPGLQLASLDYALWIHRPFRIDDWLLYALDSPVASAGRGFTRGSFFTREGVLVASVAQEGLVRQRTTAFVIK
jgi:acyl-CoA thioesterase II